MKVYLVSTGCYSDYMPRAIYSTKELAIEANRLFGDENEIEEFELDAMPEHPSGKLPFEVLIDDSGNVYSVAAASCERVDPYKAEWEPISTFSNRHKTCKDQRFWLYRMWANDEQHAVKIANERRAMAIANGFSF